MPITILNLSCATTYIYIFNVRQEMDDVWNETYLLLKEILNVSSCLMITG